MERGREVLGASRDEGKGGIWIGRVEGMVNGDDKYESKSMPCFWEVFECTRNTSLVLEFFLISHICPNITPLIVGRPKISFLFRS